MGFYPVYLNLENQPVLVVGAGTIALQKLRGLIDANAQVHVVAPEALPEIETFAKEKKVRWSQRPYGPADMEGVKLVIAATDDTALQPQIAAEARRRGLWVNVVDVPPLCDFIAPAVARRGDIQIAISTGGAAPALAKYLRRKVESLLGPEFEQFALIARHLRPQMLKLPKERRLALWERLVSDEFFERMRQDGPQKAEALFKEWIHDGAVAD